MADDALGARRDERDTLTGFLDWYRAVVEAKVRDLPLDDAVRLATPSALTPLGIVQHLGYAERSWFRQRFAGEEVDVPFEDDDNAVQFRLAPNVTVEGVLDFYRSECERSRLITADAALDDMSVNPSPLFGHVTLRWTLVHLLEETARHAGHLDLMREQIDGTTGD